ncbi:40S ribosomal protein S17 [Pseudoloma neurophilia]|uniref:40S ribosomal protein S17 n=1 Tax=Pseudoloma neurophilia TaxID=146866 RepID=A0A0R0M078_9MICR|nr:40S ribosomal protein S17 [Pseudoloma neurophilia]
MGQIKIKSVKKAAKQIVEKYYVYLNEDFYHNKKVVADFAQVQSKRTLNKVAGRVTHVVKGVLRGTAKGLYIKKHEEDREKKENYLPKQSFLDSDKVVVDEITMKMIDNYGYTGNFIMFDRDEENEIDEIEVQ